MHIDFERPPYQDPRDRAFIRLMRTARAVAASLVIGGIALIVLTSAPPAGDGELAAADGRAAAVPAAPVDSGLMALEAPPRG